MPGRTAVVVFLAFAAAYFLSALIRAITATLSPALTQEFALHARDLGLLGGGYFLGFAATQLPLGSWLDRFGPKRVILCLLLVAVLGCTAFATATSFGGLLLARILSGVGLSACLMAPLTGYRRWFAAGSQMRANSWMLMTGAFGMVASTLPVQWLMPLTGWRALFWGLAVLLVLSMVLIVTQIPAWSHKAETTLSDQGVSADRGGYAEVWRNRYFKAWPQWLFLSTVGSWPCRPCGSPLVDSSGRTNSVAGSWGLVLDQCRHVDHLFAVGLGQPLAGAPGYTADRLIAYGLPFSFVILATIVVAGSEMTTWTAAAWAMYCVGSSFISLAQPAVALAFVPALAGRALSSFNLLIFAGVFAVQWGVGLAIDGFKALGASEVQGFQLSIGIYLLCCVMSYAYFLTSKKP
jgi:MFS family permease